MSAFLFFVWFFGGIASAMIFRLSNYFKIIKNEDAYFIVNVVIGMIFAMLSWVGCLLMLLYNKLKGITIHD